VKQSQGSPEELGLTPSSGNTLHIENMTIKDGKITIGKVNPGIAITIYPDRVKLMPAISRGVTTPTPLEHLRQPIVGTNPVAVAEAGLRYYESMIREAAVTFGNKRVERTATTEVRGN